MSAFASDTPMIPAAYRDAWYSLQVKVKLTKELTGVLKQKGFEAYTPCYSVTRRWCDRTSQIQVPLFPGYVFVRMNLQNRLPVLMTPGVYGLVGFGKQAIPIEESEIAGIRSALKSGLPVEPCPYIRVGERVHVAEGPLAGISGVLIDVKKSCRVVISVELIERSIAVEVDRQWIRSMTTPSQLSTSTATFNPAG